MTVSCGREWGALDAHKPIGDGAAAREWVSPWVVGEATSTHPNSAGDGNRWLEVRIRVRWGMHSGGYWLMMGRGDDADDREEVGQDGSPPMRLSRSVVSG